MDIHEEEGIYVGLSDINNEKVKNEILSMPGVISELIRFVEFKITWSSWEPNDTGNEVELNEEDDKLIENQSISPRSIYQMGRVINLGSAGDGTLGLPINQSGTGFYTANHGAVFRGQTIPNIGTVDEVYFGGSLDVSRVNVSGYGHTISTVVPDTGITLFNVKGSAPTAGTPVKAYTGFSGIISGTVALQSANVSGPAGKPLNNMLIVFMTSKDGDSGAGLIAYPTVPQGVGILSFGAQMDGRNVTVFSKASNI